MNTKSQVFHILVLTVVLSMIATAVNAQPNPATARKSSRDTVTQIKTLDPEPPKPEKALTAPYVSEPVAPADTRGLPLASLVELSTERHRELPRYSLRPGYEQTASARQVYDPVVQTSPGRPSMPLPITNWEGLSGSNRLPPDTDGQMGPGHYVQIVNSSTGSHVRVWDKVGTQLYDFSLAGLWPVTDTCRTDASGDPIVLYDQLAGRWLLTQFALPDPPYYECIAVSKTGTPTDDSDDWWLYSFRVHETKMNDYPKFGVWPDGYYMSVNQFAGNDAWQGAGVYVFDRAAMLTGSPAIFQYFDLWDLDPDYGGLLPSNLMGNALPPNGAPNYFMSVDMDWEGSVDVMHVFEFHTDWTNPLSSTFGLVSDLVVAPFDWEICASSPYCIHQPDGAPLLDDLSDRLMMHLWYRNFSDHESLVVNHTVDAGSGRAGVRWYEVRGGAVDTTLADAAIYQQGTYAPDDTEHRWMGSIAMDGAGNMALGYSVSSVNTYPSIRYAGRQAGDPLGTLPEAEVEIIAGSGVQTYSTARWGDYSAMSVDPVDDCTFWYTQEYIETTGLVSWQTRVASFRFPSCSEPKGTLTGVVSDSVTLAPIAGATIQATASPTRSYQTSTGADGTYTMLLDADTYTVTTSACGYLPSTIGLVDVLSGTTMTQNFYLTARPQPTWTKTVYVDGVPVTDLNNIPIVPTSTIETVDRVWITFTDNVTFTLVEEWSESLEMTNYTLRILPGGTLLPPGSSLLPGLQVITATGVTTWNITSLSSDWSYVLTTTFGVAESSWTRDTITKSLWVEDADPQLDDVTLTFLHEQKIYLPLVMRAYSN